MSRLTAINPSNAEGRAKELLDMVQSKLKMTPNLMRVMANSPAVLEGYLNFSGALAGGDLPAKLRERISLAVGEANGCEYCVSAHTAIGKMTGLQEDEILSSRQFSSSDSKTDAALKFAGKIVSKKGELTDDDLALVQNAGYSEGEVAEIIANVALNIFTNYFNHAAATEIDFPRVKIGASGI